jgi:hypothetical protein
MHVQGVTPYLTGILTNPLLPLVPPPPLLPSAPPPLSPLQQRYQQQRQEQGSKLTVEDVVRCQQQGAAVVLREEYVRLQHYNINYCL